MNRSPTDAFVFFGASGDLAYKEIFPALYELVRRGELNMPVIGVANTLWSVGQLRAQARKSVESRGPLDEGVFEALANRLQYVAGDYENPATFRQLREALGPAQRPLFYLAIPPSLFPLVTAGLAAAGRPAGARVVVEKPFGRDFASARSLNRTLHKHFHEQSIFRIDHFLGKEPVQDLVYFRFANVFLEPIWSRQYVDRVEITMSEDFSVAGRGRLYEELGALRDVVQNHLFHVIALLAMEPASSRDPDSIREGRRHVFRAMRPLSPDDVVRGQYRGYRDEPGVAADSAVETFAAVRLHIDSWRWAGVPFYLRTGKRMPLTACEVRVELKQAPQVVFHEEPADQPNYFRFRLSPDVLIGLGARTKRDGEGMVGRHLELVARHRLGDGTPPYVRLLSDAMRGDPMLFAQEEDVEAAWLVLEPVLGNVTPLHLYEPGTWGPPEADRLLGPHTHWYKPPRTERSRDSVALITPRDQGSALAG